MTLRIGWFSTGRSAAARNVLRAVLSHMESGLLDVSISFVFCNWEEGEDPSDPDFQERKKFFDLVHSYDIPLMALSGLKMRELWSKDPSKDWKVCFGKKMRTMLYGTPFELGVLVGFDFPMDPDTCTRFDLVGLYPALPGGPNGSHQEIIRQVIRQRANRHGAMMHLLTGGIGPGPPVTYCSFPLISPEYLPLWRELDARIADRQFGELSREEVESSALFKRISMEGERRLLPLVTYTLKEFADGDLDIVNGKLLADGMALTAAVDLSKTVDRLLQQGQF